MKSRSNLRSGGKERKLSVGVLGTGEGSCLVAYCVGVLLADQGMGYERVMIKGANGERIWATSRE